MKDDPVWLNSCGNTQSLAFSVAYQQTHGQRVKPRCEVVRGPIKLLPKRRSGTLVMRVTKTGLS